MSEKTVLFMHIAKTGGTTLHSILTWQYLGRPSHWTPPYHHWGESLDRLSERKRRRLALVRGHFVYGVHEKLPTPSTYITLLRHPLGHVRSQYNYYQTESGENPVWDKKNLEEILANDESPWLDNVQTRQLAGIPGNTDDPVRNCRGDHYEQALERLQTCFSVVGVTDRFDDAVVLMKHRLGWRRPLFYASANVKHRTDPRNDLPQRTQDAILEANRWDLKLYEWADEQLDASLARAEHLNVESEKEKMRRNSTVISPLLRAWRSVRTAV